MSARNPLGITALVVAIIAAVIGVASTPIELVLQYRGGAPFSASVFVISLVVAAVAAVALVLGIVAARRPLSRASPGAAIGVAAFLLIGQLGGLVASLVAVAM